MKHTFAERKATIKKVRSFPSGLFCLEKNKQGLLPGEVSESLVGVRHAVGVFSLGNGSTFFAVGRHEFVSQLLVSGSAFFVPYGSQDPPECQALLAILIDLHWNLIRGTTDSLGANFDVRLNVFDRLFENLNGWSILDFLGDLIESAVENALSRCLFAVVHQAVDELGSQQGVEPRVRSQTGARSGDFAHKIRN